MGHDAVRMISERRRVGLWFTGLEWRVVGEVGAGAGAGATVGENGMGERVGERGSGGTGGIGEEERGAPPDRSDGSESRRRGFEFPRLSLNRWTILENRRRRPRGASAAGGDVSAEAADSDERVWLSVDAELSDWVDIRVGGGDTAMVGISCVGVRKWTMCWVGVAPGESPGDSDSSLASTSCSAFVVFPLTSMRSFSRRARCFEAVRRGVALSGKESG